MIPLSESAKWFKRRNKKMLWRSSNFEKEKYAPKSNEKNAQTVFCSDSSSSALPRTRLFGIHFIFGFCGLNKTSPNVTTKPCGNAARFYQNPSIGRHQVPAKTFENFISQEEKKWLLVDRKLPFWLSNWVSIARVVACFAPASLSLPAATVAD